MSTTAPTTVLMVRHAEVHNPHDILYGRLPRYRLSERGREQATCTARFLAARPVSLIYTSPLLRARQTARIVHSHLSSAGIRSSRLLLEVKTAYQGSPNSILKPGFSFYEPLKDPDDESMEDIWQRMQLFLRRVRARHPGETVVAVSHADPITVLRVGLEGRPMTAADLHAVVYPMRASVTEVVFGPGDQTLTYFNPAGTTA